MMDRRWVCVEVLSRHLMMNGMGMYSNDVESDSNIDVGNVLVDRASR